MQKFREYIKRPRERNLKARKQWWFVITLTLGIIFLYVIKSHIVSITAVSGISMEPTLKNGDLIYVNKFVIDSRISRGDIVVFKDKHGYSYIKRVVGLPYDKIRITDNQVYLNGIEMVEPYTDQNRIINEHSEYIFMEDMDEVIVPKGQLFVMGDNRAFSTDSRNGIGLPSSDDVVGKYVSTLIHSTLAVQN